MSQHNKLSANAATAPHQAAIQEFSFCKTTASGLASWLRSLPKASTGDYSRQLYQALSELSTLQITPDLRMQLLELLRPEVALLTAQLEKSHLINNSVLSSRANQVADLCQSLQQHLNRGYRQIVAELKNKRSGQLAQAIQRSLQGLFTTLGRAYLTYRNMPTGLWFEIHQMYLIAAHHKLQRQSIQDPLLNIEQTLEQAYCCTLLLGCSPANQLHQSDIKILVDALPAWGELVHLQPINAEDSLFATALNTDTPPFYRSLLQSNGQTNLLGFNTKQLIESMHEALKLREKGTREHPLFGPQFSSLLLQHLAYAWDDIVKRSFPRMACDESIELCIGMSAVHFQLSGGLLFEQTMNQPLRKETLELVIPETDSAPQDGWTQAVDGFQEDDNTAKEHDQIEYMSPEDLARLEEEKAQQLEAERERLAAKFPVLSTRIVNLTPEGYCLEWQKNGLPNLRVGDIMALRKDAVHSWSVAIIRWMRQNPEGGVYIGVEILAHRVEPCGTQLLRSGKVASDYLRALHIPTVDATSQPAQLITASIPFQEGSTVTLKSGGEESRVILGKLIQHTANCSVFHYTTLQDTATQPKAPEPAPVITEQPTLKNSKEHQVTKAREDFSALWDVL